MGGGYASDGHGRRTRILSGDGSSRIQLYSQGGQLLWSESNALSTLATATYSCSSGTLVGQQCVSTSTYAAAVALRCNAGDSLGGSTCTHTSSYTSTTNYSCPSGGGLSGNTCSRNDNYAASVNYSCNAGDGLSGSTCLHTNYFQAEVNYSCPNGDTLHYTTCATPVYTPAATSYNCNGLISNGSGLCTGAGTSANDQYAAWDACMAQGDSYGLSLNSVSLARSRYYNCIFQANVAYSCPNGGTLSGAQCISSSSYAATPNYSCGAGTLSGTQCAVPQNYAATVNYSCPGGDPLSGSTCLKTTVYTATPSYSCPSGGSLNGTSCTVTSVYAATPDYSCSGADIPNGSTCTHTTTIAATAAYSCTNGAVPSNGQCAGASSTSTAYIYLGGKQIAEAVVGGATQYVHTDALVSPVAHTSQAGAETSRTKFEPYGYTAGGTKPGPAMAGMPTTGSAIGFTGHVNDPETDLVYMQQRYYDPIAGRFLSIDPVITNANTGGSFNRYNYAANNPYMYVDPDGREIVAPAANERTKIAAHINSKAGGGFKFDKSGHLMRTSGGGKGKANYYADQLDKGIAAKSKVTVEISSYIVANGALRSVDSDFGGGVTMQSAGSGDVRVAISGHANTNLTDTNGKPLVDKAADILAHELVGHALPLIGITDTGNAIANENKVRAQNTDGAQRAPDPVHVEK